MSESNNPSICGEAEAMVHGPKQGSYGSPYDNFTRIAELWSAWKGVDFDAHEVGPMMMLVKLSREMHSPKRDNLVDIAGYAEATHLCREEEDRLHMELIASYRSMSGDDPEIEEVSVRNDKHWDNLDKLPPDFFAKKVRNGGGP